jgi:Cytochrome P450.
MTQWPSTRTASSPQPPNPDPHTLAFGFGRRICPGRILADNSLYLSIAQSLAVFSISKAVDQTGKEIDPVVSPQPGIVCHPGPFRTTIKPRSERHEALIRSIEQIHPWKESDAKILEGLSTELKGYD